MRAAISRLVRPSASRTSTSRSREVSTVGDPVVERRERERAGQRVVQGRDDVAAALAGGVDDHTELVGADAPQGDTRGAEREEVAHDVFVRRRQEHDDLGMGTQPHEPADDVGHVEVGGGADDHEIGALGRRQAHELAPGTGLGHDLDAPGLEHRRDAGPDEAELVGDDRVGSSLPWTRGCRALAIGSGRLGRRTTRASQRS